MRVCGQEFSEEVLERIRGVVAREAELSRAALARQVAGWLGWKDCRGRPKEVNCRVALLKLQRKGVIALPEPRKTIKAVRCQRRRAAVLAVAVKGTLADLGALRVEVVEGSRNRRAQRFKELMAAYHPLGYQPLCGRQIRYLVSSARYGEVAALSFRRGLAAGGA
jgi:hypothetical protein